MKKLYLVIFLAIGATIGLIIFNQFTKQFVEVSSYTLDKIKDMEKGEYKIDSNILKSSFYLYYNYDRIYQSIKEIEDDIKKLKNSHLNNSFHTGSLMLLKEYEKEFKKKVDAIHRFETLNSLIKNSQTYIPSLALRYIKLTDKPDIRYFLIINRVISTVFILKNSLDRSFLDELRKDLKVLKTYRFKNPEIQNFHNVFISHLNVFINNFPVYYDTLTFILEKNKDKEILNNLKNRFIQETNEESKVITAFSVVSTGMFLGVLGYLAYLLIKLEMNNRLLKALQRNLEQKMVTDELTGLPNRRAFFLKEREYKEPTFILVNVDNFKHINDLYGSESGDRLLVQLGSFIKSFIERENIKAEIFRLGADDFGILYEDLREKTIQIVEKLIKEIENHLFVIKTSDKGKEIDIEISINVSVGVSYEKPLLEKADMVLKYVKKRREKYMIYSEELNLTKIIEDNLKILSIIKYAINNNQIKLFYQPIFDNKTGKVAKYECLVRIIDPNGNIISPMFFLPIAKESKYYNIITKTVIEKAFERFRDADVEFSINLSSEDMTDEEIVNYIYHLLEKEPDVAKRLTFEILESESIKNYETIYTFVKNIKNLNAKIAIDDFGSGYSNYSHIVNLEPDYIKIDGSLIKQLPHDLYVQIIVSTIVDFSKKLGIRTIAEYVYNEDVYQMVKSMGIDYSQGYYLGKPSEKCCIGKNSG
ncbi:diguanylate cyclase (GGDEF) domain-containing protein [Persephonella hydrogeniphila]|uniref:Diguanylate cyclase (GGDEF) domain-containing protein n=1 Tax=Persephonella hydrogeniphila TaxID=198703 RepID=A0A285NL47_9AQUI|nr:EAL domain-containing protein [Persephonella hydrogeniphila]SNZ10189.1 diguanylate cyclase (GGDEF) domain-containing protein [Persephonella hydrogeniphila]